MLRDNQNYNALCNRRELASAFIRFAIENKYCTINYGPSAGEAKRIRGATPQAIWGPSDSPRTIQPSCIGTRSPISLRAETIKYGICKRRTACSGSPSRLSQSDSRRRLKSLQPTSGIFRRKTTVQLTNRFFLRTPSWRAHLVNPEVVITSFLAQK